MFIEDWLVGSRSGSQPSGNAKKEVRRWVRERDKNQCSQCGWTKVNPITKICPLELDHIDGDFTNNRPENLRMLCPNCHSLTPNYGSLNRGSGRGIRKKSLVAVT
jgi:5-methylcytosine-specific restriction endonuclease McrA